MLAVFDSLKIKLGIEARFRQFLFGATIHEL
jgi:hypothetical protein